jgi:hypothetical protein
VSTAGPNTCGTGADDSSVGSLAWTNPGNITASDNTYATGAGPGTSHYLKATNFGFSIPSGATINGIQVEWERKSTGGGCTDSSVKIVKGGTISGTDQSAGATWSTTESFVSFGGSSNLWGTTWTDTDINASTFGAVLSFTTIGPTTQSVDSCRITITYTAAAGGRIHRVSALAGIAGVGQQCFNPSLAGV